MAYIGNRIICPACNTPSDDDDYCTTCGEVFAQFDDEQLKREGGQAKGVIDAVDVVKYECPYRREARRVWPRLHSARLGHSFRDDVLS